jgi:glutathione S-transferase
MVLATDRGAALASEKELRAQGAGLPSPDSDYRLFGTRQEDVRVVFYKDAASWCPYCQKVWILLEEKMIPYKLSKVNMRSYGDKPAAFLEKVPNGLLPAIEIDGKLQTESVEIMLNLESLFSSDGQKLMWPRDETLQRRANALMSLERQLFGAWCNLIFRPNSGSARKPFELVMDAVEKALGETEGPWFEDDMSIVDLQFITHVERMAASVPYWAGFKIRGDGTWPNLERWMSAFEDMPSYLATKSDYYTHIRDIPPQYGPGYAVNGAAELAGAIDGTDGCSWELPLKPLSMNDVEPVPAKLDPGDAAARAEAAYKLVSNHVAITRFALRGAGEPGQKKFRAPLADPTATPATEYTDAMDAVMRRLTLALVDGSMPPALEAPDGIDAATKEALTKSLDYFSQRIGVPRDLTFPAARQLRAYINAVKKDL